jgi:hypothetical protein
MPLMLFDKIAEGQKGRLDLSWSVKLAIIGQNGILRFKRVLERLERDLLGQLNLGDNATSFVLALGGINLENRSSVLYKCRFPIKLLFDLTYLSDAERVRTQNFNFDGFAAVQVGETFHLGKSDKVSIFKAVSEAKTEIQSIKRSSNNHSILHVLPAFVLSGYDTLRTVDVRHHDGDGLLAIGVRHLEAIAKVIESHSEKAQVIGSDQLEAFSPRDFGYAEKSLHGLIHADDHIKLRQQLLVHLKHV